MQIDLDDNQKTGLIGFELEMRQTDDGWQARINGLEGLYFWGDTDQAVIRQVTLTLTLLQIAAQRLKMPLEDIWKNSQQVVILESEIIRGEQKINGTVGLPFSYGSFKGRDV